ncbi:FlgB family protein [uncultured Pelagimonas sp.]|uniref:FlgB family protein n=1 Tax=uncultured Pelagimonas sp. TaxID=1618102 RepID=UPI0026043D33|nr:FlgB family protein [uncultured Pelagimonas sp.]
MFQNLDIFRTAMAMAKHAGNQQALSAQNIANADTPGYRAREMPKFQDTLRSSLIDQKATRSTHLHGQSGRGADGSVVKTVLDPNGNSVSLEEEMVKAVDAKRHHDKALAIYRSSLTVLRTSLGR